MADKHYGCRANVTLTIEVKGEGHWGAGETVENVMRQGGKETIQAVHDALRRGGLSYRIVDEPKVGAITWGPL